MPEWKGQVRARLANLKLEPMREAAIVEELSQHLEDTYPQLLFAGMSEAEAWQLALAELAESDLLERELRRVTRTALSEPTVPAASMGGNILAGVRQDVRYAVRTRERRQQSKGYPSIAVCRFLTVYFVSLMLLMNWMPSAACLSAIPGLQ